ncbi:MAG: hypothetical protein RQ723_08520 [Desulfuromonadales bacterium]|nr:hypothetical protein [Desulfuromonadales bacterium]
MTRHLRIALLALLLAVPAAALEIPALQADLHGFVDTRYGQRLQDDARQKQQSLGETRLQLELHRIGERATLQLKTDLYYDAVVDQDRLDLEEGRGWLDLRSANLLFTPHPLADVKLGRQILTWGTGDLLFINDLFPKDWQAFFSGRDVDYLKAPSDAVLVSLFPGWANIDLVYTPRFDADRFIRGERLSYYSPPLQRRAGRDDRLRVERPDEWFGDDEWALRLSRNLAGYELALYAYDGFWKSPAGFNPVTGRTTFPRLRSFGASLRGTLGQGIGSLEAGYYDSRDDRKGSDPLVPNSEWRALLGYEQEVVRDLTAALQYYLEAMQEYGAYRRTLPPGSSARDELRHVLTLRLTRQLLSQNLTLSLFNYWSPSDRDGYLRPLAEYKLTDAWQLSAGANLFWGAKKSTFFGQFADNSNVYAAIRYNF